MQYFGFDRPSFGIKTYGFGESGPKLSADFTTGTYKASGAAKTFADLFAFSRAGKAWLVKETGLQEYAADVPRFDGGLLLEQEATNYAAWSTLPEHGSYVKKGLLLKNGLWVYDGVELGTVYIYPQPYPSSTSNSIFSIIVPSTQLTYSIGFRLGSDSSSSGSGAQSLLRTGNRVYCISGNQTSNISGISFNSKDNNTYATHYQVEGMNTQKLPTSPIVTTSTTVTRPADYLLNKITGTTVTGDWDSTLSLSIVAGKLVHSGYGRIRSLEIN